jgi:nucleotide-binding universal stress UspA family protein
LQTGLQIAPPDTLLRAVYVVDQAVHLFDGGAAETLESAYVEQGCTALERAARICTDHGRNAETALIKTHTTHDDVPHAIVRDTAEWNGDLLVLGTHGRRGIARWLLGSVAARTARLVDTPVLLARSGEATAD